MQGELDELEREEFFRLKKVQKSKHAKQKVAVSLLSLFLRMSAVSLGFEHGCSIHIKCGQHESIKGHHALRLGAHCLEIIGSLVLLKSTLLYSHLSQPFGSAD